jgi:hypothetical protein
VIAKVMRGWRPAGLLRYLFGPGLHEEHEDPRVVASWDGAPWLHHPDKLPAVERAGQQIKPGPFDLDLGPLTTTMSDLAEAAGLPLTTPPPITKEWEDWLRSGRRVPPGAPAWVRQYRYDTKKNIVVRRPGFVWHTPVRLHPTDRTLTDREWEHVAERLMRATGIQQAGCRWIAVRHGKDHIHLMATLVSERTGRRFSPHRDYHKLREECRALEREYGLVTTAPADRTAQRTPTRAEKAKADRTGREETVREELRQLVTHCAAVVSDDREFLAGLAAAGLRAKTVADAAGAVRGYAVALPDDLTSTGHPVWYSGTKLGRDLTWPKLAQRWADLAELDSTSGELLAPAPSSAGHLSPAQRCAVVEGVTEVVQRATAVIRSSHDGDGIAHATGEVLVVLARGQEDGFPGPLTTASELYDRAARTPHHVLPRQLGPIAVELRRASRHLARLAGPSGQGREKLAVASLILALAALIVEIAAWLQERGRTHQATAARRAVQAFPVVPLPAEPQHHPAAPPVPAKALPKTSRAKEERTFIRRNAAAAAQPQTHGRGHG